MSDSYHTLVVRLARPSHRKQDLLDESFRNYAQGFQYLLDQLRPAISQLADSGTVPTLRELLRLVSPSVRAKLKLFDLEPLADGLILDVAMMLRSHLTLLQHGHRSSFPLIRLSPEAFAEKTSELVADRSLSRATLAKHLGRTNQTVGRIKSIYFGRHAANRDFCLLYQPATGRFFVKLFLMNRRLAKAWTSEAQNRVSQAAPDPLYHLTAEHTLLPLPRALDRYVVLPLNFGKNQMAALLSAWSDPTLIRSARLCQSGQKTDLHIQMRRPAQGESFGEPLHWIGLARSSQATVAMSICRKDGKLVRQELLDLDPGQVVPAVRKLVRQTHAQVLLPELSRHWDGLYREKGDGPAVSAKLGKSAWLDFQEHLQSSLSQAGLPQPILVSPYHLYQTCPHCGSKRKVNRSLPELLICTTCGFSQDVSLAASFNLVAKFLCYHQAAVQGVDNHRFPGPQLRP